MLPGSDMLPIQRMFVTPIGPREGGNQARVMYPMPAQIVSGHAWARSDDVSINWTEPDAAARAHSAWLSHVEREKVTHEHGGPGRLRPPTMPPQFWQEMAWRNAAAPPPLTLSETNATPGPCGSLHPSADVDEKAWYNVYCYVDAQKSKSYPTEFRARFQELPITRQDLKANHGEAPPAYKQTYVDSWAQMRHELFVQAKQQEEYRKRAEREYIESGAGVKDLPYVDTYSGTHLVCAAGKIIAKEDMLKEYKMQNKDWEEHADPNGLSFDTLRIPWPFEQADRNKIVHQHVYDWFDRDNPFIDRYEDYDIVEMNSAYVDPQLFDGPLAASDRANEKSGFGDLLEGEIEYVDPRYT